MKFCYSNTSQTRFVLNLNVYPWGEMTSRKPNKVRFGVWLRSFVRVAVLRVRCRVVCLSSLCVGSGSRVCPVSG